ncbi:MAG: tryptophan synthase subunit alpha [Candidatus Aminicenantes bacterium]|nr:MAG: tryptophan synthase subunit alpha [Candidatus Aminicenantes bacterium]
MLNFEKYTEEIKIKGQKALVPFLTAFYPNPNKFAELLLAAQTAGADVIEIGLPFSDPVADGKIIQHSSEWVLSRGFRLKDFMDFYKEIKKDLHVPAVIMSYLNPVYQYGLKKFSDFMQKEEIAGIIFPDLPGEEAKLIEEPFLQRNISVVFMVAPSTASKRLEKIVRVSRGFIYLVTRYGVTGLNSEVDEELKKKVEHIREMTNKPIYAGFGISTSVQAKQVAGQVDGVIVGSALIRLIKGRENEFRASEVKNFLEEFRKVL